MKLPPVQQECIDALKTYPQLKVTVSTAFTHIETRCETIALTHNDLTPNWLLHFLIDFDDEVEKYAKQQMWGVIRNREYCIKEGLL